MLLRRHPPTAALLQPKPLLPSPFPRRSILRFPTPLVSHPRLSVCRSRAGSEDAAAAAVSLPFTSISSANGARKAEEFPNSSFWAAVTLIVGTAVGPGMLGLPSATIRSGPIPSTVAIVLSWVYVVSSIILVAELSSAAMREDGVDEVSFTALATDALGPLFGALVAVVYASLSFSLLVACVSGIGSMATQLFPQANRVAAHAAFPCLVGAVIGLFPFRAIDFTNRLLCALMLCSISTLVAIGMFISRSNLLRSFAHASWRPEVILPAIPITVLTLGFHVITPFVCKLVGGSKREARKAILLGGIIPLLMVLSWNAVVLGLSVPGDATYGDPIKLLLSVNSFALPAVQGFAFAALATSLIGYAVSFPKQLADTVDLIAQQLGKEQIKAGYSTEEKGSGSSTLASESSSEGMLGEGASESVGSDSTSSSPPLLTWLVLIVPIIISSFFPAVFAKALDFAGVYANCFLFGVLPPAMAWIHRSRKKKRSKSTSEDLLPGGNFALLILFSIAVVLGFWH